MTPIRPDIVITYPPDFDGELHIQADKDEHYTEFRFRLSNTRAGHAVLDLAKLPSAIQRHMTEQS